MGRGPRGGDAAPPPPGGELGGPRGSRAHEGRGSAQPPRPPPRPSRRSPAPGSVPRGGSYLGAPGSPLHRREPRGCPEPRPRLAPPPRPLPAAAARGGGGGAGAGGAREEAGEGGAGGGGGRSAGSPDARPRRSSADPGSALGPRIPPPGAHPPSPEEPAPVSFYPARGQLSLLPPPPAHPPPPRVEGWTLASRIIQYRKHLWSALQVPGTVRGGWGFKDDQDRQPGFKELLGRTGDSQTRGQVAVTMQRAGEDLSVHRAQGARRREGGEVELGRQPGSILPRCRGWGCGAMGAGGAEAACMLGLLGDRHCEMAVKITDFYCAVSMPRCSLDRFASYQPLR